MQSAHDAVTSLAHQTQYIFVSSGSTLKIYLWAVHEPEAKRILG